MFYPYIVVIENANENSFSYNLEEEIIIIKITKTKKTSTILAKILDSVLLTRKELLQCE